MTRAEVAAQLRTLGTVAVWDLAVPAVIRPCRDGWLSFMRGGHAWYGTAEAAADAPVSANRGPWQMGCSRPVGTAAS